MSTNPSKQKLVELIPAIQTSPDTLDRARAFAYACGKGVFSFSLLKSFRYINSVFTVAASLILILFDNQPASLVRPPGTMYSIDLMFALPR
jgi:hypothetical protein